MIPKIVNTDIASKYKWQEGRVARNAPFATNDTPETQVKIIGGRRVIVEKKVDQNVTDRNNGEIHGQRVNVSRQTTPLRLPSLERKEFAIADNFVYTNESPPSMVLDYHGNRHPSTANYVLPPISSDANDSLSPTNNENAFRSHVVAKRSDSLGLDRHLHDFAILPNKAVQLNPMEEFELKHRVSKDLRGVSLRSLKDVYIELTKFDPQLTGYTDFTDLSFTLFHSQLGLSISNQRLVASLFLMKQNPGRVNYERFLHFLSSSMKLNRNQSNSLSHRGRVGSNDDRPPLNMSQLLREVERQLKESDVMNLDFRRMWDAFRDADSSRSMTLTREQIKVLSYKCNIQVDEDILDQVIDQCHNGNNLYWWEKFLNFIGRFMIHKSGFHNPNNKKLGNHARQNPIENKLNLTQHIYEDRLTELEQKEKEIERLEKIVQMTRKQLSESKWPAARPEPWLDRFMKLARAMYKLDSSKSGFVKAVEAKWLTKEYNKSLNLDISDEQIESAVRYCIDDRTQLVLIEQLLRKLLAQV